jgi:hypothetical protein
MATAALAAYLIGLLYILLLSCDSHRLWHASQLLRKDAAASAAAVLPAVALVWNSCRCLCLGFFLQMMNNFPPRLVAKQCSQIFLTAFLTFIAVQIESEDRMLYDYPQQSNHNLHNEPCTKLTTEEWGRAEWGSFRN